MSDYVDDVMARRKRTYPLESREARELYRAQLEDLEQRAAETRAVLASAPAAGRTPSTRGELAEAGWGVAAKPPFQSMIVEYDAAGNMISGSPEVRARAAAANAEARAREQAWLDAHEIHGTGLFRAYATGPMDRPPRRQ